MLMVDSGAHSLYREYTRKNPAKAEIFFESDVFWNYVDDYAEFIKLHKNEIDIYVSVDVVYNSELSWKVQKYLENTHKLNPMPVFHCFEDFKWLKKYIDNYDYIGLGGLAGKIGKQTWVKVMGDPAFNLICDAPDRMPRVKTHGFAVASPELFVKYPWFSIDSASWVIYGKYGGIVIPRKKNGKYDYSLPPYLIKTSWRNHHINKPGTHIDNITEIQKRSLLEYLETRNICLGLSEYRQEEKDYRLKEWEFWLDKEKGIVEIIIENGVCNDYRKRDIVNLYYFLDMEKQVPDYPWPFYNKTRRLL